MHELQLWRGCYRQAMPALRGKAFQLQSGEKMKTKLFDNARKKAKAQPQNCQCSTMHPTQSRMGQLQKTIGNREVQRLYKAGKLQATLKIGRPDDVYEQEADRVAEQVMRMSEPLVQKKCRCSSGGQPCAKCAEEKEKLHIQRKVDTSATSDSSVSDNFVSSLGTGQPLDVSIRAYFEPRFGMDFSHVRIHTGQRSAESASSINALAYTLGTEVVFGAGQYQPGTMQGMRLLAHELTHVVQQSEGHGETVRSIRRRSAPYIRKITVHLTPKQSAELEWEGTPPPDAKGVDHFQVSTGKGYSTDDECTRQCCSDPNTQCAPPWDQPGKKGSCCTYTGNNFWTGKPIPQHNGWNWWTPIQPYYSIRGIALHGHPEVTGNPIGHGCVRMLDDNARRIYDYSNRDKTRVIIEGKAAPVECTDANRCPTGK